LAATKPEKRFEARERNGQLGQLPYKLWDWKGKLYIRRTNIS